MFGTLQRITDTQGKSIQDFFYLGKSERDKGITWQNDSLMSLPIGFKCASSSFALVADNNSCVWLICGGSGQIWKGHINQVNWKKD